MRAKYDRDVWTPPKDVLRSAQPVVPQSTFLQHFQDRAVVVGKDGRNANLVRVHAQPASQHRKTNVAPLARQPFAPIPEELRRRGIVAPEELRRRSRHAAPGLAECQQVTDDDRGRQISGQLAREFVQQFRPPPTLEVDELKEENNLTGMRLDVFRIPISQCGEALIIDGDCELSSEDVVLSVSGEHMSIRPATQPTVQDGARLCTSPSQEPPLAAGELQFQPTGVLLCDDDGAAAVTRMAYDNFTAHQPTRVTPHDDERLIPATPVSPPPGVAPPPHTRSAARSSKAGEAQSPSGDARAVRAVTRATKTVPQTHTQEPASRGRHGKSDETTPPAAPSPPRRSVQYKPYSLEDYKAMMDRVSRTKLGGLGPSDSDEQRRARERKMREREYGIQAERATYEIIVQQHQAEAPRQTSEDNEDVKEEHAVATTTSEAATPTGGVTHAGKDGGRVGDNTPRQLGQPTTGPSRNARPAQRALSQQPPPKERLVARRRRERALAYARQLPAPQSEGRKVAVSIDVPHDVHNTDKGDQVPEHAVVKAKRVDLEAEQRALRLADLEAMHEQKKNAVEAIRRQLRV